MFTHSFDVATLDKMKNNELNNVIGNGEPKYSANQMKGKTKAQLQDEALTMYHDWLAEHPIKKVRNTATGAGKGASTKTSKNRDSAASKKTNLLKGIVAGAKTVERATEIYAEDLVLQDYWPAEKFTADVANAVNGIRPKAGRRMVQLTIDLDV